jgi:hypothetical protein
MPAFLKAESGDRRAVLSLVAVLAVGLLVALLPGTLSAYHGIGGTYDMAESEFAPLPGGDPLIGDMVVGSPLNGCSLFANAAAVSGNLVLVVANDECDAPTRYLNAVAAGAAGLVAYMDEAGPPVAMEDPEGDIDDPTIPAVTIEQSTGVAITTALGNDHTVRVSLIADGDDGFYIHSRPDLVGNLTAENVTQTSLTLRWPAATDPDNDVDEYRAFRGATPIGTVPHTEASTFTIEATDLTPGTPYTFTVIAVDEVGLESEPLELAVDTLIAPVWPGGATLTATATGTSTASLSWTPATDPDGGLVGYRIIRNGVQIDTVAHPTTTYNAENLIAGQTYTFGVVAYDEDNLTTAGPTDTVTTWIAPVWPADAV